MQQSSMRAPPPRRWLWPALALALALDGCATWGPTWSEVTGERFTRTNMFRRPAIIERIDDRSAFPSMPIWIEPGMRRVVLSAPLPGWPGGSDLQVLMLDAAPCKRYYLNAQFENNVSVNWAPVIDYVEDIAGCRVEAAK